MKLFLFLFFCCTFLFQQVCFSQKKGEYTAFLQLNETTQMPVHLAFENTEKGKKWIIKNNTERIELTFKEKRNDSCVLVFPDFDSELHVLVKAKTAIGYWYNFNKANGYKIPFSAKLDKKQRKETKNSLVSPLKETRFETHFSPNTEDEEIGLGIFSTDSLARFIGTVRTTTGDYRYLQGKLNEDGTFYLSVFDGTHAFLLTGKKENGMLNGTFFSGKHYQTSFTAKENPTFELPHPDSLTTLKKDSVKVQFVLKDMNGNAFVFPNERFEKKVVIIQIMGTWCPNCMDETRFYNELYEKYHNKGLEIISVAYETPDDFSEKVKKVTSLKDRYKLPFTFLIGGKASKALAAEQFPMLSNVISFPTSIYIDKNGNVVKIHTGFNGPATEKEYEKFREETFQLMESLLK